MKTYLWILTLLGGLTPALQAQDWTKAQYTETWLWHYWGGNQGLDKTDQALIAAMKADLQTLNAHCPQLKGKDSLNCEKNYAEIKATLALVEKAENFSWWSYGADQVLSQLRPLYQRKALDSCLVFIAKSANELGHDNLKRLAAWPGLEAVDLIWAEQQLKSERIEDKLSLWAWLLSQPERSLSDVHQEQFRYYWPWKAGLAPSSSSLRRALIDSFSRACADIPPKNLRSLSPQVWADFQRLSLPEKPRDMYTRVLKLYQIELNRAYDLALDKQRLHFMWTYVQGLSLSSRMKGYEAHLKALYPEKNPVWLKREVLNQAEFWALPQDSVVLKPYQDSLSLLAERTLWEADKQGDWPLMAQVFPLSISFRKLPSLKPIYNSDWRRDYAKEDSLHAEYQAQFRAWAAQSPKPQGAAFWRWTLHQEFNLSVKELLVDTAVYREQQDYKTLVSALQNAYSQYLKSGNFRSKPLGELQHLQADSPEWTLFNYLLEQALSLGDSLAASELDRERLVLHRSTLTDLEKAEYIAIWLQTWAKISWQDLKEGSPCPTFWRQAHSLAKKSLFIQNPDNFYHYAPVKLSALYPLDKVKISRLFVHSLSEASNKEMVINELLKPGQALRLSLNHSNLEKIRLELVRAGDKQPFWDSLILLPNPVWDLQAPVNQRTEYLLPLNLEPGDYSLRLSRILYNYSQQTWDTLKGFGSRFSYDSYEDSPIGYEQSFKIRAQKPVFVDYCQGDSLYLWAQDEFTGQALAGLQGRYLRLTGFMPRASVRRTFGRGYNPLTRRNTDSLVLDETWQAAPLYDTVYLEADAQGLLRFPLSQATASANNQTYPTLSQYEIAPNGVWQAVEYRSPKNYAQEVPKDLDSSAIYCQWFSGRAVYRPGQMLQFKGLVSQGRQSLDTSYTAIYYLYDYYEKKSALDSGRLKLNAWGSFSDSLLLKPEWGAGSYHLSLEYLLRGEDTVFRHNYRLEESWDEETYRSLGAIQARDWQSEVDKRISVQAYKRPMTELVLDSLSVSDARNFKGVRFCVQFRALAGYPIPDAELNVQVKRDFYPSGKWASQGAWNDFWRYEDRELSREDGAKARIYDLKDKTDAQGRYCLNFDDTLALKIGQRINNSAIEFGYRLNFELSDPASGEQKDLSYYLRLGETPIFPDFELPKVIRADQAWTLATSYNDAFERPIAPAQRLRIYSMASPSSLKQQSLWPKADVYTFDSSSLAQHYPYDYYGEMGAYFRQASKPIWEGNSRPGQPLVLPAGALPKQGQYKLVLEASHEGDTLRKEHVLVYFEPQSQGRVLTHEPFWTYQVAQAVYQVGDTLELQLSTAADSANWLIRVENGGRIIRAELVSLRGGRAVWRLALDSSYLGNSFYYIEGYVAGRYYAAEGQFKTSPPDKILRLTALKVSDTLRPAAQDTWALRLLNGRGQPVEAELCLSLYDASLEQIQPHEFDWKLPAIPEMGAGACYSLAFKNKPSPQEIDYSAAAIVDTVMVFDPETFSDASPIITQPNPEAEAKAERAERKKAKVETLRENLNETVFFLPHAQTNAEGIVKIPFQMNEFLGRAQLLALAHTADMRHHKFSHSVLVQQALMVQPALPRFLRQGDRLDFKALVANQSGQDLNAEVELQFFDSLSGKPLKLLAKKQKALQRFKLERGGLVNPRWALQLPQDCPPLRYEIRVRAGAFSDGQAGYIRLASNRHIVSQQASFWLQAGQTVLVDLDSLLPSSRDSRVLDFSLLHQADPAWMALLALRYNQAYPYECSEQLLNRFFANHLAASVLQGEPGLRERLELMSAERKGMKQDLKNLLDTNLIREGQLKALAKLQTRQDAQGALSWMPGGNPDLYITQYTVENLNRLAQLSPLPLAEAASQIRQKAEAYLDARYLKEGRAYALALDSGLVNQALFPWQTTHLHYLYLRSGQYAQADSSIQVLLNQMADYAWANRSKTAPNTYLQAMLCLSLRGLGRQAQADSLKAELAAAAITETSGAKVWPLDNYRYYWYQQDIETRLLMLQIFPERDWQAGIKTGILLSQNQGYWVSTRTNAAVVASLLQGSQNWFEPRAKAEVSLKNKPLQAQSVQASANGAWQGQWPAKPSRNGDLLIHNPDAEKPLSSVIQLSSLQTIDQLDLPQDLQQPKIHKEVQVWREVKTRDLIHGTEEREFQWLKVSELQTYCVEAQGVFCDSILRVGDKLRVVLYLDLPQAGEYILLRDQIPAGAEYKRLEPRRESNQAYVQPDDTEIRFFVDELSKGSHRFEYELYLQQSGTYLSGMAELECMYAPEYRAYAPAQWLRVRP